MAGLRRRFLMIFQDPFASAEPRWRVHDIIGEADRAHESRMTNATSRAVFALNLERVEGLSARDGRISRTSFPVVSVSGSSDRARHSPPSRIPRL